MTDQHEVKQKLYDHLSKLGLTADKVAGELLERNIRGKRHNQYCCPITNYLKQQEPEWKYISTGNEVIEVSAQQEALPIYRIELQPYLYAISDFVEAFDGGNYPELDQIITETEEEEQYDDQ